MCGRTPGSYCEQPFILEDRNRGLERLTYQEGALCADCFRRLVFVKTC